uniref:ymf64 n=1 Tax=Cryptocaryon irritans TaxID=153251 RepID=UPI0022FD5D3B|nr:ymf64 [Cryptocaryon irritans]WBP62323.1 ymf64 [Cryptocaryon irritans]
MYKTKKLANTPLKNNIILIFYKYFYFFKLNLNNNIYNFKIKNYKNIFYNNTLIVYNYKHLYIKYLNKNFYLFKFSKVFLFNFSKKKKLNFYLNKFSWFFYFNFLPKIFFIFIFKKSLKNKKKKFYLSNFVLKKLFNNNKKNFNAPFFFNFFNFFLKNFGEFFLKKKVLINFFILKNLVLTLRKKFLFKHANNRLYKYFKKFKKKLKFSVAFDIIWLTFLFKDVSFFFKWFLRSIKKVKFNDFRRFIHFIKMLFKFFFSMKLNFFGCEGISFFIKGKFGIKGNAKKKKIFFKFGKSSLSKKKIKINFEQKQIFTKTGVLGFGFFIYF